MKFTTSAFLLASTAAVVPSVVQALDGYGPLPSEVAVGDEICVYGFVMDEWCIVDTGGTLLDDPSTTTLLNPEKHSLHCLLDVGVCNTSPYHVLVPPQDGETMYGTGWQLSSNDMVLEKGRVLGSTSLGCTTCGDSGTQRFGLRAAITGTVATTDPPVLTVLSVTALEGDAVGCMDGDMDGGEDMTTGEPTDSPTESPTDMPSTDIPVVITDPPTTVSPTVSPTVSTTDPPSTATPVIPDTDSPTDSPTTAPPTDEPTTTSSVTTTTSPTNTTTDSPTTSTTDSPSTSPPIMTTTTTTTTDTPTTTPTTTTSDEIETTSTTEPPTDPAGTVGTAAKTVSFLLVGIAAAVTGLM